MSTNYIRKILQKRQDGIHCGIPSFCTANKIVIETCLERAKQNGDYVVIEATSNQVNQNGGYTKMLPKDFADFVYEIADKIRMPKSKIILGGDHLGPLPWVNESEEVAMKEAEKLVELCVSSGYLKIHLDTSMKLGSDDPNKPLSDDTIARRGVRLYKKAEETFAEYKKAHPNAVHPVYVIGSEVPVPGGANDKEEKGMKVTSPRDFENTLSAYTKAFRKAGINDAWKNIVAVVVQPGVEFSNFDIHKYDRKEAKQLCRTLKRYPNIVFEGHSTDYQSPIHLRQMVEDGIAIIKVGPALTFALREALFQLAMIENELIPEEKRSNFIDVLEGEMLKNPKHWEKYYLGSEFEKHLNRKYGLSDRSRYYMTSPVIEASIDKLIKNFDGVEIPLGMLRQYMPMQYAQVRDGKIKATPLELMKANVATIVDIYNFAVKTNYILSEVF